MTDHARSPFMPSPALGASPVGSVVAFAGAIAPPSSDATNQYWTNVERLGWLPCDGRSLVAHQYPQLFHVLGYLYGGSDDQFNLPDYRGYFLRCVDPGQGVDPDRKKRTKAANGETSGVGSTQTTAIQMHEHDYNDSQGTVPVQSGSGTAAQPATSQPTTGGPIAGQGGDTVPTSKHETRPVNIYVNYIIRYATGMLPFGT